MAVKLRGLDRYEVEAIQYDGTNSDEICQLTVEKIGETEKAVQYRVTFWIVENPGHPVCWEGKEYYFGRWLPKRVVTPIDDTHIGIPKKFLEETIELLAKGHPFREVRYNAQFKQETLQWTKPTKPEKS